jgi:hypothetical protein
VRVRLRDGRVLTASANGARGYPARPASDEELATKFLSCAARALPESRGRQLLAALQTIEGASDIRLVIS